MIIMSLTFRDAFINAVCYKRSHTNMRLQNTKAH